MTGALRRAFRTLGNPAPFERKPSLSHAIENTTAFEPGRIVATPGALAACNSRYLTTCLRRHLRGDWGCVADEDKATNHQALEDGSRLLSAYPIDPALPCLGHGANTLWIITEADRSVTTFLLPEEY
jgi:hypothetical protein